MLIALDFVPGDLLFRAAFLVFTFGKIYLNLETTRKCIYMKIYGRKISDVNDKFGDSGIEKHVKGFTGWI